MKFTINVDCTPEEARIFFGLPDLKPMQDQILQQMQDQMSDNMKNMDPQEIMKAWMPGVQNITDFQKMMWDSMTNVYTGTDKKG